MFGSFWDRFWNLQPTWKEKVIWVLYALLIPGGVFAFNFFHLLIPVWMLPIFFLIYTMVAVRIVRCLVWLR